MPDEFDESIPELEAKSTHRSYTFLKKFEATVKCCTQNGVRGGSATVHFPIWHKEIEDIIVLKNNKGTEDNRVRKLDYSIQLSKLFYERFIDDEEITLFSPHEVPELYEALEHQNLTNYTKRQKEKQVCGKRKSAAQTLFFDLLKEKRAETCIYIMNIDHCNTHSSFKTELQCQTYVKRLLYLLTLFNTLMVQVRLHYVF